MSWRPFQRKVSALPRDPVQQALHRGDQAQALVGNETLLDAVNWGKERALQSLRDSTNPDEAWQSALELQAAEHFEGVLQAYFAGGQSAAKRLAAENDRMLSERERSESATEYKTRAERARKEFAAA